MKWAFDAYEVTLATDREEAIAQLRHSEPAVVTLDLGLPPDAGWRERRIQDTGTDPRARA